MIKGSTKSGFEFEIPKKNLDDWELLEALEEMQSNPLKIIKVSKMLLGNEQYNSLKKYCTVEGKVKMSMMDSEITEIMNFSNQTKNY